MPQVDVKYSYNLKVDIQNLLQKIETTINEFDSTAGACKSRAYPAPQYLHEHITIEIQVLRKPHRDEAFMQNLLNKLTQELRILAPKNCYFALKLDFTSVYYITQ